MAITDKYLEFRQEMSDYRNGLINFSVDEIRKKFDKVQEKLSKVNYITPSGYNKVVDISHNFEEQDRIQLRFELMINTKRISGLLRRRNVDYDIGWSMINRLFLNPNDSLNGISDELDRIKRIGVSFIDTLTLDGLKAYGNYLTDVYNNTMFEGMKIIPGAVEACKYAFAEFPEDAEVRASLYLPKNFETLNKNIEKCKILSEVEMIMSDENFDNDDYQK